MRRRDAHRLVAIVALAAACVVAGGCYHAPQPGRVRTIPPVSQWQRVRLADAGFSVRMPGQPSVEREVGQDFDGTRVRTTSGRLLAGNAAVFGFAILEADGGFIQDPYARAREMAETTDTSTDEVVRWEKEFRHGGFVANDRVVDMKDGQVSMYVRLLLGKTRVYGMFLAYPTQAENHVKTLLDTYLQSAECDPSDAVSPMGDGRLVLDDWHYIYPRESDFAVRIPGSARGMEEKQQFAGEEVTARRYGVQSDSGDQVFEVIVRGFEGGPPDAAFERAKQQMTSEGLAVESERFVHQRGFGGRAVVYRSASHVVHAHYYGTLGRMYEVRVWTTPEPSEKLQAARGRFLSSFRIL